VVLHRPLQVEPIDQPLSLEVQRYRLESRRLATEGAGRRAVPLAKLLGRQRR